MSSYLGADDDPIVIDYYRNLPPEMEETITIKIKKDDKGITSNVKRDTYELPTSLIDKIISLIRNELNQIK